MARRNQREEYARVTRNTMLVEARTFDGKKVKTLNLHGKVLWCAKDVCIALGLGTSTFRGWSVTHLDESEVVKKTIRANGTALPNTVFVTEAGLYRYLMRSDKPSALRFQRWLAGEVLPQIASKGRYRLPKGDMLKLGPIHLTPGQKFFRYLNAAARKLASIDAIGEAGLTASEQKTAVEVLNALAERASALAKTA